jgi:hypothetical protein
MECRRGILTQQRSRDSISVTNRSVRANTGQKPLNNIDNFNILRGAPSMSEIICYCFGYTAEDIKKDYTENGRSTILERIIEEKKKGNCRCEQTNPKKR